MKVGVRDSGVMEWGLRPILKIQKDFGAPSPNMAKPPFIEHV